MFVVHEAVVLQVYSSTIIALWIPHYFARTINIIRNEVIKCVETFWHHSTDEKLAQQSKYYYYGRKFVNNKHKSKEDIHKEEVLKGLFSGWHLSKLHPNLFESKIMSHLDPEWMESVRREKLLHRVMEYEVFGKTVLAEHESDMTQSDKMLSASSPVGTPKKGGESTVPQEEANEDITATPAKHGTFNTKTSPSRASILTPASTGGRTVHKVDPLITGLSDYQRIVMEEKSKHQHFLERWMEHLQVWFVAHDPFRYPLMQVSYWPVSIQRMVSNLLTSSIVFVAGWCTYQSGNSVFDGQLNVGTIVSLSIMFSPHIILLLFLIFVLLPRKVWAFITHAFRKKPKPEIGIKAVIFKSKEGIVAQLHEARIEEEKVLVEERKEKARQGYLKKGKSKMAWRKMDGDDNSNDDSLMLHKKRHVKHEETLLKRKSALDDDVRSDDEYDNFRNATNKRWHGSSVQSSSVSSQSDHINSHTKKNGNRNRNDNNSIDSASIQDIFGKRKPSLSNRTTATKFLRSRDDDSLSELSEGQIEHYGKRKPTLSSPVSNLYGNNSSDDNDITDEYIHPTSHKSGKKNREGSKHEMTINEKADYDKYLLNKQVRKAHYSAEKGRANLDGEIEVKHALGKLKLANRLAERHGGAKGKALDRDSNKPADVVVRPPSSIAPFDNQDNKPHFDDSAAPIDMNITQRMNEMRIRANVAVTNKLASFKEQEENMHERTKARVEAAKRHKRVQKQFGTIVNKVKVLNSRGSIDGMHEVNIGAGSEIQDIPTTAGADT